MKLLVVIVNFRVPHLVVDCLQSVQNELVRVGDTCVAVSENGSGDDSTDIIREAIDANGWSSWCTLTTLDVNQGFTGGNNVLIAPALKSDNPPRYVLLLNPDTVVRSEAFAALLDFMDRNPNVGIAGSRLENPDGTPQRSAFKFITPLSEFEANARFGPITRLLQRYVVAPPVVDHTIETDWVSGASLIARREVFENIGLLDEGFFTYFDDIDFCFNARKHGWSIYYVPASRVVHLVGQSTGVNSTPRRLPAYLLQARRRYFLKNHGPLYAALADAGRISGLALARLRGLLTAKDSRLAPHVLSDSIKHSVFLRGFKLTDVKLPDRL
jgi:GT2 family glycosyltransferase